MKSFLEQVVEHYYEEAMIGRLCFILPNRRSLLFLKKHLSESLYRSYQGGTAKKRAYIVPAMYTIDDFFYSFTNFSKSDNLSLLLDLYEVYKSINTKAESLDLFLSWGSMILSDFNEVDKYVVDAAQLFSNIYDYKEIRQSYDFLDDVQKEAISRFVKNFDGLKRGDENKDGIKEGFVYLWHILYDMYRLFNERLKLNGRSYTGMVYRWLAERFDREGTEDILKDKYAEKRFVFVGFNALTTSEKKVMKALHKAKLAEFCWDYSSDMIQDENNRSSFFMRENIASFPQAFKLDVQGLKLPSVKLIESPSAIGQAKLLPAIFQEIANEYASGNLAAIADLKQENMSTAVVLPDEKLLNPVINSIPHEIEDINITMGYDFFSSQTYLLLSAVLQLQLNLRNKSGEYFFYHKDFRAILSNDIIKNYLNDDNLLKEILLVTKYYISEKDLLKYEKLSKIFCPVLSDKTRADKKQIRALQVYLQEIISLLSPSILLSELLEKEKSFMVMVYCALNKLMEKDLDILPTTFVSVFRSAMSTLSVHFRGEPLKGLQLMGPLEMRALDFDNLIILSCNENMFPRKNVANSFIPASLRLAFSLPTYEYQDAVWAYYFYRMIQRANNVYLVYDSRQSALQSGEESRYIKQLEYLYKLPLERRVINAKPYVFEEEEFVEKPKDFLNLLKRTRLSASALQNYLTCNLKFYYSNILHLSEQEEVVESADAGIIGKVYHNTMYSLYTSIETLDRGYKLKNLARDIQLGKIKAFEKIDYGYLEELLSQTQSVKAVVERELIYELNTLELEGRNLLIRDIVCEYVLNTLKYDMHTMRLKGLKSFKIEGLEYCAQFVLEELNFVGYIDRLDSFDDYSLRILDYKSGKVQDEDINIDDSNAEAIVSQIFAKDKRGTWPKIAFQLYIYYKLIQSIPAYSKKRIVNAIYSLSRMYSSKMLLEADVSYKFIELMDEKMSELLCEIKDLGIPFKKTSNVNACTYCDFKKICGR